MATAGQLVTQILNEILVRESESPMQADEVQDVIFNMNVYMLAQSANGINLGYTAVADTGDTITVPDGALMGIIANVAIMMAPTFSATISPGLIAKAKVGMMAMRKLGVSMSEAEYPSILPIGSGNEGSDYDHDRFYPDQEATILQESGGSIGLEDSTI
jgi:hypothetical protein